MSIVQRINFEPVSDILPVHRRDFPVADIALINPMNALVITDGEWLTLSNQAGVVGKLERATDITSVGDKATQLCFPVFAERGRYDVQAMSGRKLPILFMGQYEFDTRIFKAGGITKLLQPLRVETITLPLAAGGTRNFSGLVAASYDDTDPIVGYVTRLPANNKGRLRFISGWSVRNGTT